MTDLNINGVNPNINIQSTTQNQATQNNNNIDSSIFNFDVKMQVYSLFEKVHYQCFFC